MVTNNQSCESLRFPPVQAMLSAPLLPARLVLTIRQHHTTPARSASWCGEPKYPFFKMLYVHIWNATRAEEKQSIYATVMV